MITARKRLRILVIAIAPALVAFGCFAEIWSSLHAGKAEWALRRSAIIMSVTREQGEVAFFSLLAAYAVIGAACVWYTLRLLGAVAHPGSPANEAFTDGRLAQVEAAAPSGLRPLWVGLAIAFVYFLIYVASA